MSLLLDALKRAAHRREPDGAARAGEVGNAVTAGTAPATDATATAQAVFRSTEGQRRAFRRRHALIMLAVFALAGAAAAAGWMYWQGLQDEFTRDLARYQIDPESSPAADVTAEIEMQRIAADAAATAEETPAEATTADPASAAAEQILADWEDTAEAVAAAGAAQANAEDPAPAAAEAAAATAEADPEPEPEPPAAAEPEPEPEPEPTPQVAEPEPAADPEPAQAAADVDVGQAEATTTAPRQATPMVQRSQGPSPLEELLHDGYTALQAGDLRAAERAYGEVLERRPDNRDALLGSAAVAQQRGDLASARTYYARVLADEPRDPHAMAGLLSLDGVSEPRRAESELKMLLRDHPDSHAIHFALGNLYAAEARWGDAQQSYFEAVRGDNANPNYVFNLAVALDHLGQRDAARQQYEQALQLAENRGSAFAPASVRTRIEQLR